MIAAQLIIGHIRVNKIDSSNSSKANCSVSKVLH